MDAPLTEMHYPAVGNLYCTNMKTLAFVLLSGLLFLPTVSGQIVINEFLANPSTTADSNGDGIIDATQDEFVEIVNTSSNSIDLANYTLSDSTSVRHTFASPTILLAGQAFVVFGGGTPTGGFGASKIAVASTGTLSLANTSETISLKDTNAFIVASISYLTSVAGKSQTRAPDITGNFVNHDIAVGGNGSNFSPGKKINGSTFITIIEIYTAAELVFFTQTNVSYQVQYLSEVGATNWINLGVPFSGAGSNTSVFDSTRTSGKRFYRVVAQ